MGDAGRCREMQGAAGPGADGRPVTATIAGFLTARGEGASTRGARGAGSRGSMVFLTEELPSVAGASEAGHVERGALHGQRSAGDVPVVERAVVTCVSAVDTVSTGYENYRDSAKAVLVRCTKRVVNLSDCVFHDSYCTLMCSPASGDGLTTPEHQFWVISDFWPPTFLIRQLWGSDEITEDQFILSADQTRRIRVASMKLLNLVKDAHTACNPLQALKWAQTVPL
eukprot:531101-Prymnesium_polylepis.2